MKRDVPQISQLLFTFRHLAYVAFPPEPAPPHNLLRYSLALYSFKILFSRCRRSPGPVIDHQKAQKCMCMVSWEKLGPPPLEMLPPVHRTYCA